jgi:hypothetical protein
MKRLPMVMLLIACLPALAFAAQIYGNLRWNNAAVGEGVVVKIQCPEGPYEGRTDGYGSYSVALRPSKKCGLSVYFANQWSVPFDVFPYEDPVRYDFDIVRQGNGTLALVRR